MKTVLLSDCRYDKVKKVLYLASGKIGGMPNQFMVHSDRTGKEFRFDRIGEYDLLYDQDGWDGEMCIYRPTSFCDTVDHLIVYNEQ